MATTNLLTKRERQVAELLTYGNSQKEAAARLHISPATVDVHVKHIKEKTGLQKATELECAWLYKKYGLPLIDLPEYLRKRIALALLVLSLFSTALLTTDMVRVFRTAPARRVASRTARRGNKNTDYNYLPLTA